MLKIKWRVILYDFCLRFFQVKSECMKMRRQTEHCLFPTNCCLFYLNLMKIYINVMNVTILEWFIQGVLLILEHGIEIHQGYHFNSF